MIPDKPERPEKEQIPFDLLLAYQKKIFCYINLRGIILLCLNEARRN